MNDYKLEQSNGSLFLKTINREQGYGIVFIGICGLFMFLLPIAVTIFLIKGLSWGGVASCLFAWLLSGYFLRLYLWNKYGEEVFIISNGTLETYNDYKLFKDNRRLYKFTKLDITFFVGEEAFNANGKMKDIDKNQLSEIGFQLDEDVITSHRELPISKIIEIAEQIKGKNR
jgi:hypothetical protein